MTNRLAMALMQKMAFGNGWVGYGILAGSAKQVWGLECRLSGIGRGQS